MKLEIERKFLLKAMPAKTPDYVFTINQYYLKNKSGIWERARIYHSEISGDTYIHTIKKSLSKGINIENEKKLTKEQFEEFKAKCLSGKYESRFIQKERCVYKEGELNWEVDKFGIGYNLILAEIEIPKKGFKITFPDYISEVLLLEVTKLKQFSNRSLSIKI
jgi:CYTH domain-containing protein